MKFFNLISKTLALLFTFLSLNTMDAAELEKPISIIIPSYNNKDWYQLNLDSIFAQEYKNFRIIYINDCSKDATGQLVESYLQNSNIDYRKIDFDDSSGKTILEKLESFKAIVNQEKNFVTLINNVNRCGALSNLYRAIQSCDDNDIIVTIDGDDWLYHPHVLKELNAIYSSYNVWLTHGTLKEYPSGNITWCEPIPNSIVKHNKFREFKCPSHLRTFYSWLFKKIELNDMLYEGNFFAMAWDMAIMYPMIEMAGKRHAFIKEPNYVYNMANQINDNKVNADLQNKLDRYIRGMKPYKPLKKRPKT